MYLCAYSVKSTAKLILKRYDWNFNQLFVLQQLFLVIKSNYMENNSSGRMYSLCFGHNVHWGKILNCTPKYTQKHRRYCHIRIEQIHVTSTLIIWLWIGTKYWDFSLCALLVGNERHRRRCRNGSTLIAFCAKLHANHTSQTNLFWYKFPRIYFVPNDSLAFSRPLHGSMFCLWNWARVEQFPKLLLFMLLTI